MDDKISKYKKIYKIFLILMLIGLIDSIIIPILLKSMNYDTGETGFIPMLFITIGGKTLGYIGFLFTTLWFVWGLVAAIANRKMKSLEKKQKEITQNANI